MGYRTKPRTREIVCEFPGLEPDEGCEPLRATVRTNLTFDELDAIPVAVFVEDGTVMYRSTAEMRAAIAPYVLAWNIDADDVETGETVPVIPPAEAGPDVLRTVDPLITDTLDAYRELEEAPLSSPAFGEATRRFVDLLMAFEDRYADIDPSSRVEVAARKLARLHRAGIDGLAQTGTLDAAIDRALAEDDDGAWERAIEELEAAAEGGAGGAN
jgi:hypothetical protein